VLARSLVAQKKFSDARAAADRAASLAKQGSDRLILMTAGLADAEVDTRTGKAADAERNLTALHDQAKRDGYLVFELEARLLMSQAEIASGEPAAAHARLDRLESDARSKGFLLIARKSQVESHH
jgi:hypothetical protein